MSPINLPLIIKEYVIKMLNEASAGMKALIVDEFTVRTSFLDPTPGPPFDLGTLADA